MKQEDLLKTRVSIDDMQNIQRSMDEAQKDDTPFAVVSDDSVKVAGDPNKTERKSRDYSVRFRFPESQAQNIDEKDIIKRVAGYVVVKVDFNDVHIVPRRDMDITAAIVKVIPYFQKIQEDGITVENRTADEMVEFVKSLNNDIGDDLYDLVAAVLNIDKSLKDNMIMTDVIDLVGKFPNDFPEVFREADAFFE